MLRELAHFLFWAPQSLYLKGRLSQAELYDRLMGRAESHGMAPFRRRLVEGLRGDLEGFLRGGAWMPTRFVPAGSFIVREGEPGDAAYVIVDGMCAVTKVVDAQTVTLRVLGPGDVFGETAVITAGPRSATVVARTDVTLKVVTAETLDLELSRNAWLRRFVEALAQRFRDHDVELSELRARAANRG